MLPQMNPYYFQQPMYQMPQLTNYTQNVSQVQMPTINGRLIDNVDSVTANDVPMQGISVFPKNDLSEVYIKSWQPNGTIQTIRYLKTADLSSSILSNDKINDGNDKVARNGQYIGKNDILDRLTEIENEVKQILAISRPKKGVKNEPETDN